MHEFNSFVTLFNHNIQFIYIYITFILICFGIRGCEADVTSFFFAGTESVREKERHAWNACNLLINTLAWRDGRVYVIRCRLNLIYFIGIRYTSREKYRGYILVPIYTIEINQLSLINNEIWKKPHESIDEPCCGTTEILLLLYVYLFDL